MSHLGLNILSTIHGISTIWGVRYWEVSLYFEIIFYFRKNSIVLFFSVIIVDLRDSLLLLWKNLYFLISVITSIIQSSEINGQKCDKKWMLPKKSLRNENQHFNFSVDWWIVTSVLKFNSDFPMWRRWSKFLTDLWLQHLL